MNTNIKSTAPLWAQLPPTSPQTPVTPQPPPEPSFRPQYPYCAAPTPAAEAVPELDTAAAAYDAQLHQSAAAAREVAEQQAAMVARQRQLMEIQQSKERQKLPQQQQQVEAQQQVGAQEQKARQQQKQQQKAHAPAAGDAGRDLMLDNIMEFKSRELEGSFNDWLVQLSPEDITRAIMSSKQGTGIWRELWDSVPPGGVPTANTA